jgi:hypothetical protein
MEHLGFRHVGTAFSLAVCEHAQLVDGPWIENKLLPSPELLFEAFDLQGSRPLPPRFSVGGKTLGLPLLMLHIIIGGRM